MAALRASQCKFQLRSQNRRPDPYLLYLTLLFYQDIGIARTLEIDFPGRTFVVIPIGRLDIPPGATLPVNPDYQKFDRALKTQVRLVLVPLQRLPFRDYTAEEFLGNGVFSYRVPGCWSQPRERRLGRDRVNLVPHRVK